jgi:hypothetical protein
MKTPRFVWLIALPLVLMISCQRNANDHFSTANEEVSAEMSSFSTSVAAAACNPDAYIVTLESKTLVNGAWEWVWSVQNSNPGNGNNGTFQDLSHWGMALGACFEWSHLVSAAYSYDGTNWSGFNPANSTDPSQNCLSTPVLKFDAGTVGSAKTYYRITLSANYNVTTGFGYYRSGNRTGCCTFNFLGIGCQGGGNEEEVEDVVE